MISRKLLRRPERLALPAASRWARLASNPATVVESPDYDFSSEEEFAASIVHGRAISQPYYHERTHDVPIALIHFRSYIPSILDLFIHFASHAASSLAVPISRPVHLPTQRSLWTVPKGPFVHKKSQENFERKVHKRVIKAWDADPEVVERWVRYLRRHAMAGVGMRIVRWDRVPVGIGQERLKNVMGTMRLSSITDSQKVKALAEKIVQTELAVPTEGNLAQEISPKQEDKETPS